MGWGYHVGVASAGHLQPIRGESSALHPGDVTLISWTGRLPVEGFQVWIVLSQEPDTWKADRSKHRGLGPAYSAPKMASKSDPQRVVVSKGPPWNLGNPAHQ